jgi:hypothetical protein
MNYMTAHSSAEQTSIVSPASASPPSTDGSGAATYRRSSKVESAGSHGPTSTSSLQRDANWLRTATVEQIDSALDHGQLNRLLGLEPMT